MSNRDPETGRFLKGNNGGPGRQKGSRNKLAEDFISDLYASWQKNGAAAIERMLVKRPAEYVKVVASILPKQLEIKDNVFDGMNDERLALLIHEAGEALKLIEGEAKDVTPADQVLTAHSITDE
jgi:hypothetical protein